MLSFGLQFAVKIAKAFDCLEYVQEKEVCQCEPCLFVIVKNLLICFFLLF